jgi:hypothetical protein
LSRGKREEISFCIFGLGSLTDVASVLTPLRQPPPPHPMSHIVYIDKGSSDAENLAQVSRCQNPKLGLSDSRCFEQLSDNYNCKLCDYQPKTETLSSTYKALRLHK